MAKLKAAPAKKPAAKKADPVRDDLYGTLHWTSEVPPSEIQAAFATLRDASAQGRVSTAELETLL